MNRIYIFLSILFLSGCSRSYWNYHTTPPNNNLFANAGETQITGTYGTGGGSAQTGIAITKNFSLLGSYSGSAGVEGYHSKEGEFGVGWQLSRSEHKGVLGVSAGYGLGSNFFQDSGMTYKPFRGTFNKPFVMVTFGTATIGGKVKGDASMSLKLNYMTYDGVHQYSSSPQETFKAYTFYYEPYFNGNVGGRHVRFTYGFGIPFKNIRDIDKGMHIYPFHINFGMMILFGRKYNEN